jgi:hypothetical protein
VSRERAHKRAARLAEAARGRAKRERAAARTARRRALRRRLTPRQRRTGRLYARRAFAERATIAVAAATALGLIWWQFDDLATRLALTVLVAVAAPALVVLTFDRRT